MIVVVLNAIANQSELGDPCTEEADLQHLIQGFKGILVIHNEKESLDRPLRPSELAVDEVEELPNKPLAIQRQGTTEPAAFNKDLRHGQGIVQDSGG